MGWPLPSSAMRSRTRSGRPCPRTPATGTSRQTEVDPMHPRRGPVPPHPRQSRKPRRLEVVAVAGGCPARSQRPSLRARVATPEYGGNGVSRSVQEFVQVVEVHRCSFGRCPYTPYMSGTAEIVRREPKVFRRPRRDRLTKMLRALLGDGRRSASNPVSDEVGSGYYGLDSPS